MKLGIYGDSYADCPAANNTSWVNVLAGLLSRNNDNVKVFNHARGGSSVYFSYKKFLATHHQNDLNIFLVTEPNRYPGKFKPSFISQEFYITSTLNVEHLESDFDSKLTQDEKEFLNNLRSWFKVNPESYTNDMSDIMIGNIERLNPNTIIYPCFIDSLTDDRFKKFNLDKYLHPMHSFWYRQLELFDIEYKTFRPLEKPTISAHLTVEFNAFFAKVLYSKITTGKWDHSGFFDIKIEKPKTHYYYNWD